MRFLPYILKHLRHNWIRTASTVLAMAVCIFLFCVLQTVIGAINFGLKSASDKRLVTRHSVSLVFNLPLYYKERVGSASGVKRVAAANWFGGVYKDPKNFFPNFAINGPSYLDMYPEYLLPAEQRDAFLRDLRGCVVGRKTADKFGWKLGDTVQLESFIPTYRKGSPFDLVIRGIYDSDEKRFPGTNLTLLLFHHQYLYEALGRRVGYGALYAEIEDPGQAGAVSRAIDALFANSEAETKTETEAAFRAGFISLAGNLALLLHFIGLAVTFTILGVTANTMSMAVRERRKEIAVLKTLGFSGRLVMGLVLIEAVVLGVMGGGLGILLGGWMVSALPGLPVIGDFFAGFPSFRLSIPTAAIAFGLSVAMGFLAGVIPAFLALRATITTMLRQV